MESAENVAEQFIDGKEYFAETSRVLEGTGNLVWGRGAGNTTSRQRIKGTELRYLRMKEV